MYVRRYIGDSYEGLNKIRKTIPSDSMQQLYQELT